METQNLIRRYQVRRKVPSPNTSAPEGTKISDDLLCSLLFHYRKLDGEDYLEFSGIDLHGILPRGSQTAEIAVVWETETEPEPLKLRENHTTLESAVSYIFETAAAWFHDDAAAQDKPRIFALDWKGLRMILVATSRCWTRSRGSPCFLDASFTTTDSEAWNNGQEEDTTRRENATSYLLSHLESPRPSTIIFHGLRARVKRTGGEQERYVGQRLHAFFDRQGDAKETHSSNENIKIVEEGLKDTIARAASPGSVTKLFASKHTTKLGKVRMTSYGLLDSLSVTVGKMFRRTTYHVDENGGFEIITRSQAPRDPSEIKVTAEASVGFEGAQLACGLEKVFQRRPYIRQSNDPAHNRIFTGINVSSAVRRWFLSSLIKGNILVHKNSKADSFIPSHVMRATAGGILLNKLFPAWYFSVLGGDLVSIGDYMFFRRHWTDDDPLIVKGTQGRLLILGEDEEGSITESVSTVDWAYYWSLDGWKVGSNKLESATKSSTNSSSTICDGSSLKELTAKVDTQGALTSRIQKVLESGDRRIAAIAGNSASAERNSFPVADNVISGVNAPPPTSSALEPSGPGDPDGLSERQSALSMPELAVTPDAPPESDAADTVNDAQTQTIARPAAAHLAHSLPTRRNHNL